MTSPAHGPGPAEQIPTAGHTAAPAQSYPMQARSMQAHPVQSGGIQSRSAASGSGRARSGVRLHHLLFIAFTIIAGAPIAVLALWESNTSFQNELDSVRERHLLVARNLTTTMSRYVKDVKSSFTLAFATGSLTQPMPGVADLLQSLSVVHVCILNPDGSLDSVL